MKVTRIILTASNVYNPENCLKCTLDLGGQIKKAVLTLGGYPLPKRTPRLFQEASL